MTTYTIKQERQLNAADFGEAEIALITKPGTADYVLGSWQYDFTVEVTNDAGETHSFSIVFQADHESEYSLELDIADESQDLIQFCDGDERILNELTAIATVAAKAEYKRLIEAQNFELASEKVFNALTGGYLIPLSAGAPNDEQESVYSIASEFYQGDKQDALVKQLLAIYPCAGDNEPGDVGGFNKAEVEALSYYSKMDMPEVTPKSYRDFEPNSEGVPVVIIEGADYTVSEYINLLLGENVVRRMDAVIERSMEDVKA